MADMNLAEQEIFIKEQGSSVTEAAVEAKTTNLAYFCYCGSLSPNDKGLVSLYQPSSCLAQLCSLWFDYMGWNRLWGGPYPHMYLPRDCELRHGQSRLLKLSAECFRAKCVGQEISRNPLEEL